jgi:hypothetical protein
MIIILGVVIAMKDYVKRGVQGRWKSAVDDFGGQYDPAHINSDINYSTQGNSTSIIQVLNYADASGAGGQWTNRIDLSNTLETKTGFSQVGD